MNLFDECVVALRHLVDECERAGWPNKAEHLTPIGEARRVLTIAGPMAPPAGKGSRPMIPIEAQIKCVRREIDKRIEVYPRLTSKGSMTLEKATAEIATMRAVLDTLQQVDTATRLL